MYATVRVYTGNRELIDALVENEGEVKRVISELDGFKAYYLLRTGDGGVSVSVFENESSAQESNRVAAAWIRENVPEHAGTAPQISAGEVVIAV